MPNLGFPEILVILVVALLVFGPRKLPELGKSLGAGLREFRRSAQGLKEELDGVMNESAATTAAQPTQVQVISAQPQVVMAQDAAVPVAQVPVAQVPVAQMPVAQVPAAQVAVAQVTPAQLTPAQVIPAQEVAVKPD